MQLPKLRASNIAVLVCLILAPALSGCLDNPSRAILNRGYSEMAAKQYDQADADADEFLRAHPNGTGVAEAYYLKGRIDEQKAQDPALSPTIAEKTKWLDRARDDYQEGLRAIPPIGVRAILHTGVANVDYHEEDYGAALREWKTAYENLPNDDSKAWVLYHIGRCQQRMGLFAEADKSFADVSRYYPGSEAAFRASSKIGANAFYVEVGQFPDPNNAEQAAGKLRKEGYPASRTLEAGRQIVRVGPLPTFPDAKAIQSRVHREYPGAVISP